MSRVKKELFNKELLDKWFSFYTKIKSFYKRSDATNGILDEELAHWLEVQRSIQHMLPKKLIDKLKGIDFEFENKHSTWETMYRKLAGFIDTNGHSYLSESKQEEMLKDWLIRQILNKKYLSEVQFHKLNSLGIHWHMPINREQRWEQMYVRLKDFQKTFGHCRVPQKWANDQQLANWIAVNRRMYASNKLPADRYRRLGEIGFVWNGSTQYHLQWEMYFEELAKFQRTYGHCQVPGTYVKLVSWIERQRIAQTKNRLSEEQERRLNELKFIWSFRDIKEEIWQERYKQLQEYKQKNGHCFVAVNFRENKKLGVWVATQRRLESKGKLEADKKKKLSEIGFVWSTDTKNQLKSIYNSRWEANFAKLVAYKQVYGTCQVSLKLDPALQRWTRWQRILFYKGKLTKQRLDKLNEICFPWSIEEGYWMKMYDALSSFRHQFGHTRVPYNWTPNLQLAKWIYRVKLTKSDLPAQKIKLLDLINFEWTLNRKIVLPWKVMYDRLLTFKKTHGHTRVPVNWHKDPKLGKWVSRMRYEREKLTRERIILLEAIGFDWSSQSASIANA